MPLESPSHRASGLLRLFSPLQAVLYDRGFDPASHGGVLSLFGSEIIAVGNASRRDSRFFSRLSELRQQADYGYGEFNKNVDAPHSRTQRLVFEIETPRTEPE